MSKLRVLSAAELLHIFAQFGFAVVAQRGSHVKLARTRTTGRQTLTIPQHPELDKGTVKAIYRQGMRYISEQELYPHFYTE